MSDQEEASVSTKVWAIIIILFIVGLLIEFLGSYLILIIVVGFCSLAIYGSYNNPQAPVIFWKKADDPNRSKSGMIVYGILLVLSVSLFFIFSSSSSVNYEGDFVADKAGHEFALILDGHISYTYRDKLTGFTYGGYSSSYQCGKGEKSDNYFLVAKLDVREGGSGYFELYAQYEVEKDRWEIDIGPLTDLYDNIYLNRN